jgi:hypothetical protein
MIWIHTEITHFPFALCSNPATVLQAHALRLDGKHSVTCRLKAAILEAAHMIVSQTTKHLSTIPPQRTTE